MNEEKIYEKAIKKWGNTAQILVAMEEMSELTKVLLKHLRHPKNEEYFKKISEEMVDVEIMINQLKVMFPNNNIEEIKNIKLARLEILTR